MERFSAPAMVLYGLTVTFAAFDLLMSLDPHWISTLFGAYYFVGSFYTALALLAVLSCLGRRFMGMHQLIKPSCFHDLGKLYFAFCLLWADFFYCQFLVIWYGNIPEETSYLIQRTMTLPWNRLAWAVFILSFVIPFLLLINKEVKTRPRFMIGLCSLVLVGIWLEHYLLLGPSLNPRADSIPISVSDVLIALGFLGLMAMAVRFALARFPELIPVQRQEVK